MTIKPEEGKYADWALTTEREGKYPFAKLEVGGFFKIPDDVMIKTMRVAASYWNAKYKNERHFRVISKTKVVVRVK